MPKTSSKSASKAVPNSLPLEEHICFSLYSASLSMTKVYKPLLKKLKLTYPQYLVLLTLWEQDVSKVSEIGHMLFLDSGTLTPVLKKLEVLGYLQRMRCEVDERCVLVKLTAAGRAVQKKTHAIPACITDAAGCTPKVLEELNSRLQFLRSSLRHSL